MMWMTPRADEALTVDGIASGKLLRALRGRWVRLIVVWGPLEGWFRRG